MDRDCIYSPAKKRRKGKQREHVILIEERSLSRGTAARKMPYDYACRSDTPDRKGIYTGYLKWKCPGVAPNRDLTGFLPPRLSLPLSSPPSFSPFFLLPPIPLARAQYLVSLVTVIIEQRKRISRSGTSGGKVVKSMRDDVEELGCHRVDSLVYYLKAYTSPPAPGFGPIERHGRHRASYRYFLFIDRRLDLVRLPLFLGRTFGVARWN